MIPLLGLRARRLPPDGLGTMRDDQPAPSEVVCALSIDLRPFEFRL